MPDRTAVLGSFGYQLYATAIKLLLVYVHIHSSHKPSHAKLAQGHAVNKRRQKRLMQKVMTGVITASEPDIVQSPCALAIGCHLLSHTSPPAATARLHEPLAMPLTIKNVMTNSLMEASSLNLLLSQQLRAPTAAAHTTITTLPAAGGSKRTT